jgi:hypothetical protein
MSNSRTDLNLQIFVADRSNVRKNTDLLSADLNLVHRKIKLKNFLCAVITNS